MPSVRDDMQDCENARKNSSLKYETVALPAELDRRFTYESCFQRVRHDPSRAPCYTQRDNLEGIVLTVRVGI